MLTSVARSLSHEARMQAAPTNADEVCELFLRQQEQAFERLIHVHLRQPQANCKENKTQRSDIFSRSAVGEFGNLTAWNC